MYTIAPTQDVKRFESQQLTAPLSSLNTLIILAFSLPWTRGCPTAGFPPHPPTLFTIGLDYWIMDLCGQVSFAHAQWGDL